MKRPTILLSIPLAHLPVGFDRRVEVSDATWAIWRFDDGALLVEEVMADGESGRAIVLPTEAVAELGTVAEAVGLAIEAADRYGVIGRVATAIMHGVVLQSPCVGSGRPHHASVGPRQAADGTGGYACILDGDGPVPTWQVTRTGPVPERESDHGPFAASLAFVNVVGPVMAVRALRLARARATCAESRLDAERDRLVAVLRARVDRRTRVLRMLPIVATIALALAPANGADPDAAA